MMKESQAVVIKDAFEHGVTTCFESNCKRYTLYGYDEQTGSGKLTIYNLYLVSEKLSWPIALAKIEGHQLVLVLDGGDLTFTFFYEVGA